jgi:hypothetical protein
MRTAMAARRQPMEAPMQMPMIKVINVYSFHIAANPFFSIHFFIFLGMQLLCH